MFRMFLAFNYTRLTAPFPGVYKTNEVGKHSLRKCIYCSLLPVEAMEDLLGLVPGGQLPVSGKTMLVRAGIPWL